MRFDTPEQFRSVNLTNERAERLLSQPSDGGGPSSVQALSDRLVAFVNSRDIERVVIDSTMLLESFFAEGDAEMTRVLTALKSCDATALLTSEMTDPSAYSDEHFLAHGIVRFHDYPESTGMTRGVVKMRGTDIDCDIRSLRFTTTLPVLFS